MNLTATFFNSRFWLSKFGTWLSHVRFCSLRLVCSRSRELILRYIILLSDSHVLRIISKVSMFVMRTRSVAGVEFYFISTDVEKLVLSMMFVNQGICLNIIVVSRSWCFGNFIISLSADCHVFRVTSKVTMLILRTRTIIRIKTYLFPSTMEEFILSMMFIYLPRSLFMFVLSWAGSSISFKFTLQSNGHVFWVITEIPVFIMGPWAIFSIEFDFLSSIVVKLILSMVLINQTISLLMFVLSWAGSNFNLMITLQSDCHAFWVITEISMLLMSPWAIFSIEFDFLSSIVVKLILSMMLENQFISLFMIIFSRARSFRNLMFSLLTDSHLLCIITKVAMFLVSTRSIFCI